jgi:uridine phosphorylase
MFHPALTSLLWPDNRRVTFPNVEGKHADEALFDPRDYIAYLNSQGNWDDVPVPEAVVLFYQARFFNAVLSRERAIGNMIAAQVSAPLPTFQIVERGVHMIGLAGGFGIGSPAATAIMEGQIAVGISKFISIGTAGALQRPLRPGSVVVCDRAIRDEGVSHHYLSPSKYAHPSPRLTQLLRQALSEVGVEADSGTTWTIDAPYRETIRELKQYQAEGVLTVDMEAAALAAVAEYRGVEFATAFSISDSVADMVWDPQFRSDDVTRGLEAIYAAALSALLQQE